MSTLQVQSIGQIQMFRGQPTIQLKPEFIPAMQALDGFSHLQVIWWFSDFDSKEARSILQTPKPYTTAPETMGIFATRSPVRPNPIALTAVQVMAIDYESGRIHLAYIDANEKSPVLDIKPYTPSLDRVEQPLVPDWCRHWPKSLEQSAAFDWSGEFNF